MTPRQQLDQVLAKLRGFANPAEPDGLMGTIFEFQRVIWGSSEWRIGFTSEEADVLRDLAYDLDFYEADQVARSEDPSFFGAARAIELIHAALGSAK